MDWVQSNRIIPAGHTHPATHPLTHPPPQLVKLKKKQGHLRSLAVTDLYDYLTQGHDPTTVGIFLGARDLPCPCVFC